MVTTRCSVGMCSDRAFKKVVLPDPVPPETKMLYPARTRRIRKSAASCERDPRATIRARVNGSRENLRMEMAEPSMAMGESTTLTREPSCRRASTMGWASLTVRLALPTICWITSASFSSGRVSPVQGYSCPSFS